MIESKNDLMKQIYENVAEMTLERIKKEKATRLSRRTLKMIALTQTLYNIVRLFS